MNPLRKAFCLIFLFLCLTSFSTYGQNTETKSFTEDALIKASRDIIEGASTCALITLNKSGLPSVRVMDPFLPESDFTVWFGTNPKSRKVNQIKNNPNVTLYYLDKNSSGYVVIHGIATLVDDQSEKDKWWKTEWEAFYPNNAETYLLIKVKPNSLEVVSYEHGILGNTITWKAPQVLFDSIK